MFGVASLIEDLTVAWLNIVVNISLVTAFGFSVTRDQKFSISATFSVSALKFFILANIILTFQAFDKSITEVMATVNI